MSPEAAQKAVSKRMSQRLKRNIRREENALLRMMNEDEVKSDELEMNMGREEDVLSRMLQEDAEKRDRAEKQLELEVTQSRQAMQLSAMECHATGLLYYEARDKMESTFKLYKEKVQQQAAHESDRAEENIELEVTHSTKALHVSAMELQEICPLFFEAREKMDAMFKLHKEKLQKEAAFLRK